MAQMKAPKILLYGSFGSGKTAFVATGGEAVDIVDLDEGLRSALTYNDKWTEQRKIAAGNAVECYESDPKRAIAFNKARAYISGVVDQCSKGTYERKVLVIDSLTTLSEYAMRSILAANSMLGKQPQIQHWGIRDIFFKNLLIELKALPVAVIVIAHQQTEFAEGDNSTICPAIAGKSLPPILHSQFDEILYARTRTVAQSKVEYIIENKSNRGVIVRTRSNFENFFNMNRGLKEFLGLMHYEI
jgi:hypothetical protein